MKAIYGDSHTLLTILWVCILLLVNGKLQEAVFFICSYFTKKCDFFLTSLHTYKYTNYTTNISSIHIYLSFLSDSRKCPDYRDVHISDQVSRLETVLQIHYY